MTGSAPMLSTKKRVSGGTRIFMPARSSMLAISCCVYMKWLPVSGSPEKWPR